MIARVLIVAGSDSGGGAGIQADIKTVTALGGFATTAVTAITAQNTLGVFGVVPVPAQTIEQQMRVVLDDIGADAIKTGMLADNSVIEVVAGVLTGLQSRVPVVVDPVMIAQSGDPLIESNAVDALAEKVIPMATVLTPNLPEAERLLGRKIDGLAAMRQAARDLLDFGAQSILLKGGHAEGAIVQDVLASQDGLEVFESPRIDTKHTHGTGCTLASAIATGLAQGLALPRAVARARAYLFAAISHAPGFGQGSGPVHHGHSIPRFDC